MEFILIYAVIIVALIFLIREIVTWYWKINAIVFELREQNDALNEILIELKRVKK